MSYFVTGLYVYYVIISHKSIKTLNIKAVADILGHTTTEITERYYVKKDTSRLTGITDGFEI